MKVLALVLIAGYVSLQQIPTPSPMEKAGTCPVSDIITTCDCRPENIECNEDDECPGPLKCCSYGCGCRMRCLNPVGQTQQANNNACTQPQVRGRCKAYMPRYWYNVTTNQCEEFIYGGCGGNDNNFERIEDCQNQCEIE